jgi:hypothetical protein
MTLIEQYAAIPANIGIKIDSDMIHWLDKFETIEDAWDQCGYPDHLIWMHKHSLNPKPEIYEMLQEKCEKTQYIRTAINKAFEEIKPETGGEIADCVRYQFAWYGLLMQLECQDIKEALGCPKP